MKFRFTKKKKKKKKKERRVTNVIRQIKKLEREEEGGTSWTAHCYVVWCLTDLVFSNFIRLRGNANYRTLLPFGESSTFCWMPLTLLLRLMLGMYGYV